MPKLSSDKFETSKLPTFRQACKALSIQEGIILPVEFIWLPKEYKTITLQTAVFRIGVDSDTNSGEELLEVIEKYTSLQEDFLIQVIDIKKYSWELETTPATGVSWEFISDTGLKRNYVPHQEPAQKTSRARRKR